MNFWRRPSLVKRLIFQRIEASVDVDFTAGHRWLRSLGFKCEAAMMQAFDPMGRTHSLYALVR